MDFQFFKVNFGNFGGILSYTQNLDPIGSAVLKFIGYKQTNWQAKYKDERRDLLYELLITSEEIYYIDYWLPQKRFII